jgi:N-acetylmuramoyl-L-alanine amidase
LIVLSALLVAVPVAAKKRSVAQKKKMAMADFAAAERLREALDARPEAKLTRRDYTRVIDAYRKVYFNAPTSAKADDSIFAVAELTRDVGRQFDDAKASQAAIGQFEFLRREYPGSKYRVEALFDIAEIYRDDLNDRDHARVAYQDFLKHYPQGEHAREARAALKDMDEEARAAKSPKPAKETPPKKRGEAAARREQPAIRDDEKADEIVVPVEGSQAKSVGALGKPDSAVPGSSDRKSDDADIVTKPAPAPVGPPVLVTAIRHWSTPNYTRVAVDLGAELTYDSDHIDHPERIYFDLHNSRLAAALKGKTIPVDDGFLHAIRIAQYQPGETRVVLEVDHECEYSAFLLPNPARLIVDIRSKRPVDKVAANSAANAGSAAKPADVSRKEAVTAPAPSPKPDVPLETASVRNDLPEASPRVKSGTGRDEDTKLARSAPPKKVAGAKAKSPAISVHEARPTAAGDRSLIRALGLKIGRIVVDAGHGGHDTGTIGPNGLLEKDLVLDVALRLGKLLENRLGAEVVYTRDDDTFIPLETRTAIANQEQADLFISVHANSSHDPSARGVETYYLNFTTSADALEVAARENAVSDQSIHQLQDLVKKIALKEKVEESREFASDVQQSMASALKVKSRGVKQAPFIVLIGANMPSILAEISFVSNPTDAKKLKTEAYREKIAESLYRGIAKYVEGLSGLKVAADKQVPESANQPPVGHRDPSSELP